MLVSGIATALAKMGERGANTEWYLVAHACHGDAVVRVRPGMWIGETPSGDLSFQASCAQLGLAIDEGGGIALSATPAHELECMGCTRVGGEALVVDRPAEIRLSNNVLKLVTDFLNPEVAEATVEVRTIRQGTTVGENETMPTSEDPPRQAADAPISWREWLTPLPAATPVAPPSGPVDAPNVPREVPAPGIDTLKADATKSPGGATNAQPPSPGLAESARVAAAPEDHAPRSAPYAPSDEQMPEREEEPVATFDRLRRSEHERAVRFERTPEQREEPIARYEPYFAPHARSRRWPLGPVVAGLSVVIVLAGVASALMYPAPSENREPEHLVTPGGEPQNRTGDAPQASVHPETTPPVSAKVPVGSASPEAGPGPVAGPHRSQTAPVSEQNVPAPVERASTPRIAQTRGEPSTSLAAKHPEPTVSEPTVSEPRAPLGQVVGSSSATSPAKPTVSRSSGASGATRSNGANRAVASTVPAKQPPNPRTSRAQTAEFVLHALSSADIALAEGRLTTPTASSAYTLYKRALALDPESTEAKRGLNSVRQGLINRAMAQLAGGALDAARESLQAAAETGADPTLVANLRREVDYRERSSKQ